MVLPSKGRPRKSRGLNVGERIEERIFKFWAKKRQQRSSSEPEERWRKERNEEKEGGNDNK